MYWDSFTNGKAQIDGEFLLESSASSLAVVVTHIRRLLQVFQELLIYQFIESQSDTEIFLIVKIRRYMWKLLEQFY